MTLGGSLSAQPAQGVAERCGHVRALSPQRKQTTRPGAFAGTCGSQAMPSKKRWTAPCGKTARLDEFPTDLPEGAAGPPPPDRGGADQTAVARWPAEVRTSFDALLSEPCAILWADVAHLHLDAGRSQRAAGTWQALAEQQSEEADLAAIAGSSRCWVSALPLLPPRRCPQRRCRDSRAPKRLPAAPSWLRGGQESNKPELCRCARAEPERPRGRRGSTHSCQLRLSSMEDPPTCIDDVSAIGDQIHGPGRSAGGSKGSRNLSSLCRLAASHRPRQMERLSPIGPEAPSCPRQEWIRGVETSDMPRQSILSWHCPRKRAAALECW